MTHTCTLLCAAVYCAGLRHLTDEALGHAEDTGLDVLPEDVQDRGQVGGELASLQVHQVLGERELVENRGRESKI